MSQNHIKESQENKTRMQEFLKELFKDKPKHVNQEIATAFDVATSILEAGGQTHLLALIVIRRFWFQCLDEFFAKHTFARNISMTLQFIVSEDYLEKTLPLFQPTSKLFYILKSLQEQSFAREHEFVMTVQKRFRSKLSESEKEQILKHAAFKPHQTTLHITVYDGGFAQAVHK